MYKKIYKTKIWLFEKFNKINESLAVIMGGEQCTNELDRNR